MIRKIVAKILRAADLQVIVIKRSENRVLGSMIEDAADGSMVNGWIRQFNYDDATVRFFIENPDDVIQHMHLNGRFYEEEELRLISKHFNRGCFVDIGSNVGNHAIFASRVLHAKKVVAFEPNPDALRILEINILLNDAVDDIHVHRLGLSDKGGRGITAAMADNLGGARLLFDSEGPVEIARGDDIILEEPSIDFVKIDTEGLELRVLTGLRETIAKHRPKLCVEVDNSNKKEFLLFLLEIGYDVIGTYKRYEVNENFICCSH